MEQFLQVGAITSTHGIRGEVKVFPTTDDPARFKKLKKVILDTGKRQIDMEIQSVRFFKQFVIVKFKGIDNINDVEQYKGSSLFVSRENAVSLEENEYYIADLIGIEHVALGLDCMDFFEDDNEMPLDFLSCEDTGRLLEEMKKVFTLTEIKQIAGENAKALFRTKKG